MPKTKTGMTLWLERVRKAMELSLKECEEPRAEYIEALEELASDIEGMLDAAREEETDEDRGEAR